MTRGYFLISLFLPFLSAVALATSAGPKKPAVMATNCDEVLSSQSTLGPTARNGKSSFRIIESTRAPEYAVKYRAYVEELTTPNGILDQLGIEMTGQIVEFVQPRDLNALTSGSAGGYPISHYLDGAAVLKSLNPTGGFALEVVYPGPDYQHGFYRDDNPEAEQVSIIDHVVGHNHFAHVSGLEHYRVGQGLEATKRLDLKMRALYNSYDEDQIQRYYLFVQTLMPLVDWYTPLYNPSKDFEPKLDVTNFDPLGRTRPEIKRHPRFATENVLQAFAANIAPNDPPFKRDIIEEVNISMAFRPALVHTQIMNEGWASIMQEIIPPHTKTRHNFNYWFAASRVMQTENVPNLKDPYSLGVACWRHLWGKFEARPEIKSLKTQMLKDNAFIAYATNLIATMTDEQFLRLAMDQKFVDKFKLAVSRRATDSEIDRSLPQPPPKPGEPPPAQWVIISREAERVVAMVINNVLKPKYFYNPRVKLVDFNRPATGEVELVLDDEAGRAFPLKSATLGPSLYALANIIKKPISLECSLLTADSVVAYPDWIWNLPGWMQDHYKKMYSPKQTIGRYRVVVSPNAELRAYRIDENLDPKSVKNETLDQALSEGLSKELRAYLEDLYLENDVELEKMIEGSQSMREWAKEAIHKIVEGLPYDSLVSQSPNAAGAIMKYKSMLDRRLVKAMLRAANKKGGVHVTQTGVRVRALPSVVEIEFDRAYINTLMDDIVPAPIRQAMTLNRTIEAKGNLSSGPFDPDQGGHGSVGPKPRGEPGDKYWGPGDPSGGQEGGRKPGEDHNDLSWVDIPKDLYDRFLGERVKLPILNQKPGASKTKAKKPGARINRRQGQMLPTDIMENALKRGIGTKIGEDEDPFEDLSDTFDEGFDRLQPRDWVVKNTRPTKKPDIKAVVTFVLDASGSTATYMEAFKRFVNDMEALIRSNYKGFDFRYIVFDTEAQVMKNRNEFFKSELGGGTVYTAGIKRAHKLYEDEYPRSQWDRYTFLMGDMEDWSEAMAATRALLEDSEYFGTVAGLHSAEHPTLMTEMITESQSTPGLGYTIIDPDGGFRLKNLKEVLKNEE